MGIITTKEKIGIDATNFFNYLSGYTEKPNYQNYSLPHSILGDEFL